MGRWQAVVLIVEQGVWLGILLWLVRRFGQFTKTVDRLKDSTNYWHNELQLRSTTKLDAINHVAPFTYDDREESA